MFKIALFDLDGTLFDTLPDIHGALEFALTNNGLKQPLLIEHTRSFIGDGLKAFLQKAISATTQLKECPEHIINDYLTYYGNHCSDKTRPYDGIEELLCKLQINNIKMAVVSNKSEVFVKKILKHYNFERFFAASFGGDSFSDKKPSSIPILSTLEAISASDVAFNNIIMIGDSENDIASGNAAGIKTCWCTYGYGLNLLSKPDYIVSNSKDIYNYLFNFR